MYNATTKEYLFGRFFLLANKLQVLGDSFLTEMTTKQWILLIVIYNMDKKQPNIIKIAEELGTTRQNVRKMLETLCKKGYVTLILNEQDKRNLSVSLTEKTLLFFNQFKSRGDIFIEQLFDGISSNFQENTKKTVEILLNNIEEMGKKYGKNN